MLPEWLTDSCGRADLKEIRIPEFLDSAVRLLKPVVDCDGCGWFIFAFDPEPKILMIKESDPCVPHAMIPTLGFIAHSDPFVERWANIGEPVALMLSDFPQRLTLRHCDEHRDFYACVGKNLMTVPLAVSESGASALTFRSYRRPFTEEDRMVANLLRPHLQQAFANAETFSKAMNTASAVPTFDRVDGLTERESQVAFWIAQGKTNR